MKAADRTNQFELQHTIGALSLWGMGLYDSVRITLSFVDPTDKYLTEVTALYRNTQATDDWPYLIMAIWDAKTGKFSRNS